MRREASILNPRTIPDASPDPDDNLILAIAVAGRADYLASLDKSHVLILEKLGRTRIVRPGELLKKLG
jgi:predicted nucleic acid-binding protein